MLWDLHITLPRATNFSRQPFSSAAGQLTATSILDPSNGGSEQRRQIPLLLISTVSVATGEWRLWGSRMV
jgi:hypothetical protein